MDGNGDFAVNEFLERQLPRLDPHSAAAPTTIVTFKVGPHGPYTLVYPAVKPNPAQVLADINAQVEEVKQTYAGIATINQANQTR